jgi:transcriptional regulator with XRE-family HTH domain
VDGGQYLQFLEHFRRTTFITQADVARTMGVSQSSVSSLLKGTKGSRMSTIQRVGRALGLPPTIWLQPFTLEQLLMVLECTPDISWDDVPPIPWIATTCWRNRGMRPSVRPVRQFEPDSHDRALWESVQNRPRQPAMRVVRTPFPTGGLGW